MNETKTILSAGLAMKELLQAAAGDRVTDIFPGYADEARLPYISYRRKGLDETPIKVGRGATAAIAEVMIFAETYGEAVEIAEAVNAAIDNWSGEAAGLRVRGIGLQNAYEEDAGDAKCQVLEYRIRI